MIMHNLCKPTTDFSELFTLYAKNKRKPASTNLLSKLPIIISAVTNYDSKASQLHLHELLPIPLANLAPVTSDNLISLYETQMLKGVGRSEYDKMLQEKDRKKSDIPSPVCGPG
jgi:hypothetical protein